VQLLQRKQFSVPSPWPVILPVLFIKQREYGTRSHVSLHEGLGLLAGLWSRNQNILDGGAGA